MRARRRRRIVHLVIALSTVLASLAAMMVAPASAAVPAGFADQFVAAIGSPTAMDFTPDGRLLVATQGGALRVIQGGDLLTTPAIDLSAQLCSNSERGLLGVAVDPAFTTNGFVFLYYSFKKTADCGTATVNRVSRFVMTGNTLAGESVLIDNIPSPAGNHNAGDLNFGKDDNLYVSVGDGGCDYPGGTPSGCGASNDAARDLNALVGKILRIDRDANIPAGNPFTGTGTARCNEVGVLLPPTTTKCQEIFATGLRNPFRMAFDSNSATTKLHINDVGQGAWEEIDLGAAGADYGWNVREGHCVNGSTTDCGPPPAGMTNPIFDYGHADGCRTITGGAFVPTGVWPSAFDGKYLFADYGCGKIFRLDPNGTGGFTRTDFATGLGGGSAVDLTFGPWKGTQALYYTTYADGGQVRRITTTAGTADDYNGDGRADRAVFRPASGTWFVHNGSSAGYGISTDIAVPGDYDGNGSADMAVFRPSVGVWFVRDGSTTAWGTNGDVPVPGDYDGDRKTDLAVFRPSSGTWFIIPSSTGVGLAVNYGVAGDVPVPADYDSDGKADIAVFRPGGQAFWFVRSSKTNTESVVAYGTDADVPVAADYDGDGLADIAVFRPSSGTWFIRRSSTGVGLAVNYGTAGDVPSPADYDLDAKADIAVFRPSSGVWFVRESTTGSSVGTAWGAENDQALILAAAVRLTYFP